MQCCRLVLQATGVAGRQVTRKVDSTVLARQASSSVQPQWETCRLPLSLDDTEERLQVEVGRLEPPSTSTSTAPILAIHPSGSSYRQWSKLAAISSSPVIAPNMFGYGETSAWPPPPHRGPSLTDFSCLVSSCCSLSPLPLHLLGHSMGGGVALAAAALLPTLPVRSLTVFEPNLFSILAAGNSQERQVLKAASHFFEAMLAAAEKEDWEVWGQTFHAFWFKGRWEDIDPGVRAKLVQSTTPHTVHEIQAVVQALHQGEQHAQMLLDSLESLKIEKRIVLSNSANIGSSGPCLAMASLLAREAGFQVVHSPVGGHMGPLTHPHQVLPLLCCT